MVRERITMYMVREREYHYVYGERVTLHIEISLSIYVVISLIYLLYLFTLNSTMKNSVSQNHTLFPVLSKFGFWNCQIETLIDWLFSKSLAWHNNYAIMSCERG